MLNQGDMRLGQAQGWYGQRRVRRVRRSRLRLRSRLLLGFAAVVAVWLLIGFSLPHNGLLIAALMLMLGLMGLIAGLVLGLFWLARRTLRRATSLEGLADVIGAPWLGRTGWAARTVWPGGVTRPDGRQSYPAHHDDTGMVWPEDRG